MQKDIIICDKCGKREEYKKHQDNTGFKQVEMKFDTYNVVKYDLCPECQEKYGLPTKNCISEIRTESTADKLYNLIAEIVAENQGGNC